MARNSDRCGNCKHFDVVDKGVTVNWCKKHGLGVSQNHLCFEFKRKDGINDRR